MAIAPPAKAGDPVDRIDSPALSVDLDALDRNIARLAALTKDRNVRVRPHAKAHKSVTIGKLQMAAGAVGLCCQKLSEAEALAAGGLTNLYLTNEVVAPAKLERLAKLARDRTIAVCVDWPPAVRLLAAAAERAGSVITVLVEVDVGQQRCGVTTDEAVLELAGLVVAEPALRFGGLQTYHGRAQHFRTPEERRAASASVAARASQARDRLTAAGIPCRVISGGGTGTLEHDLDHGVLTEIQAGSYIFMDGDYRANRDAAGGDYATFEQSLFVRAAVVSAPAPDRVVTDAGLKAMSIDSGMPGARDFPALEYRRGGDEHGILAGEGAAAALPPGSPVWFVPSHCDTTVCLHDWLVGWRGTTVEAVIPIEGRGAIF